MEKIVIFDTGIRSTSGQSTFDRNFAHNISHTLLPICYAYEEAKKEGILFIEPEEYIKNSDKFNKSKVLLISHLVNDTTQKIIALGATPFLLTCQESPFIATRFYIKLKKYTALFKNSMVFPGMKRMISKKSHYIPMFFPQFYSKVIFDEIPFKDKSLITYIASNKQSNNFYKTITIKLLYGLNVKMIYPIRMKIINSLSHRNDFDLYGRGWETEKSIGVKKVYRGEIVNKEEKLREYKFVLCLENSIFPGYITEKIFDSFFAQSVPIYLGAPDIENYIPKDTFIDIRDFKDINELEKFIDQIDEATYKKYIIEINKFLVSDQYKKFGHEEFSNTLIKLIKNS